MYLLVLKRLTGVQPLRLKASRTGRLMFLLTIANGRNGTRISLCILCKVARKLIRASGRPICTAALSLSTGRSSITQSIP